MASETFDIVFRGDIQFGQNVVDVRSRLQQLFKIDAVKIDALFTGKPVVLKRGLDQASAEKYRDVLSKAGALIEVISSRPQEPSVSTITQTTQQPKQQANDGQWTLAPVGSLLVPAAHLTPADRNIDLSAYSLRPPGGNLVDETETPGQAPALLSVPEYQVADVGANLIESSEKNELPLLEIDVDDWGLSEPGAPLLKDNERKAEVASPVQDVDFSLAPVGSLLEEIKPDVEIKIPDISALKILE